MKKIPILKKTVLILFLLFSFFSYSQTISLGIEHEEIIKKEISDENELSINTKKQSKCWAYLFPNGGRKKREKSRYQVKQFSSTQLKGVR